MLARRWQTSSAGIFGGAAYGGRGETVATRRTTRGDDVDDGDAANALRTKIAEIVRSLDPAILEQTRPFRQRD